MDHAIDHAPKQPPPHAASTMRRHGDEIGANGFCRVNNHIGGAALLERGNDLQPLPAQSRGHFLHIGAAGLFLLGFDPLGFDPMGSDPMGSDPDQPIPTGD